MKTGNVSLFAKNLKIGLTFSILFTIIVFILGCGTNEAEQKTAEAEKKMEYIYTDSYDCDKQLSSVTKSKNDRLLFFDSKGMFDQDEYQQTPSARIRKLIKNDTDFQTLAEKNFDFIIVTQDCEIGQHLSIKYGIKIFPMFILQDEKGIPLYKNLPMLSIDKMKAELSELYNKN